MSFTLPEPTASGGPGQTKAQRRLIPGVGDDSAGEALLQQLWTFDQSRLHSN
jgi:hypothetical protein